MKQVVLMCGIPGSGKSTALRELMKDAVVPSMIVSRDKIRFNIMEKYYGKVSHDSYFSHEKEVFKEFVNEIKYWINQEDIKVVYADATHISKASRKKIAEALQPADNFEISILWMDVDFNICLERNFNREGIERVPESAMNSMINGFEVPSYDEPYITGSIYKYCNKRIFEVSH